MVAYLANGWFSPKGSRQQLRVEVVDGALERAASLAQADVHPTELDVLLLRVHTLIMLLQRDRVVAPLHGFACPAGTDTCAAAASPAKLPPLSTQQRQILRAHLQDATDDNLTLQVFMLDCLEHVHDLRGLRGLYMHLLHCVHVLRLLRQARQDSAVAQLLASRNDMLLHLNGRSSRQTHSP